MTVKQIALEMKQGKNRGTQDPVFVLYDRYESGGRRFISVFFTEKAAEEYLARYHYRYDNPLIFAHSFNDNTHLQRVANHLLEQAPGGCPHYYTEVDNG